MIEAEKNLICSMIMNPNCLTDVFELVGPSNFVSEQHKRIVQAISEAHAVGDVDILDISEKTNEFEYITGLVSNGHAVSHGVSSRIVQRESLRRLALNNIQNASMKVVESETTESIIASLSGVNEGVEIKDSESVDFDEILKDSLRRLDSRMKGEAPQGLMTGFDAIDERLNGIKDGNFRIVAARPAMGKTTLIMNEVFNIADRGGNVLVFSMEMAKEELTDRLIASAAGINSKSIATGKFDESEIPLLQLGMSKLKGLNIHIIDKPALDIAHLANIARKFNRVKKLDAVYIDYLQLIRADAGGKRFDEISHISRELKALAKRLNCPVTALSQLNRGLESRTNKRPVNADLRESGQIEQDADIIQFIYRDEIYNPESNDKGFAEILTTKFRGGEIGVDFLESQLQFNRFIDTNYLPAPIVQKETYQYKRSQ